MEEESDEETSTDNDIKLELPRKNTGCQILQLKDDLKKDISCIVNELGGSSLIFDENRLTIVRKFLFLSHLIGELNIIFATIWRYKNIEDAWLIILDAVSPVLDEMDGLRRQKDAIVQSGMELTSLEMKCCLPKYYDFFMKFDAEIEKEISDVSSIVPFETRIMDILSCCPTAEFKLSVIKPHQQCNYCSLSASYSLWNVRSLFQVPSSTSGESRMSNLREQSRVVKLVRDCVRCDNAVYLQSVADDLATKEYDLNTGDKSVKFGLLCQSYDRAMRDIFPVPVFSSSRTYIEDHAFLQEIYSRGGSTEGSLPIDIGCEGPGLIADISFPYMPMKHLPLMIQSQGLNIHQLFTSKRQDQIACSFLKEYNAYFRFPHKPQVELRINLDVGPAKEVTIKTFYNRNEAFCITRVDPPTH